MYRCYIQWVVPHFSSSAAITIASNAEAVCLEWYFRHCSLRRSKWQRHECPYLERCGNHLTVGALLYGVIIVYLVQLCGTDCTIANKNTLYQ